MVAEKSSSLLGILWVAFLPVLFLRANCPSYFLTTLSVGIIILPRVSLLIYPTHMTSFTDTHHHNCCPVFYILVIGYIMAPWINPPLRHSASSLSALCRREEVQRLKRPHPWEETGLYGSPVPLSFEEHFFLCLMHACVSSPRVNPFPQLLLILSTVLRISLLLPVLLKILPSFNSLTGRENQPDQDL